MIYIHTHIKHSQCNCNRCAKHWEVPPWSMYFWSFKQLSYNSCISVRLGQVAPDEPLATHIQAEASTFTIPRKKCVFVPGVWVAGREWAGRELEAAEVRKKDWLLFTSLPQSSMQIQVHLKSEDIDISSAMITLLNEMIHISIKIFTPEVLFFFFSFPSFQENVWYHIT